MTIGNTHALNCLKLDAVMTIRLRYKDFKEKSFTVCNQNVKKTFCILRFCLLIREGGSYLLFIVK